MGRSGPKGLIIGNGWERYAWGIAVVACIGYAMVPSPIFSHLWFGRALDLELAFLGVVFEKMRCVA